MKKSNAPSPSTSWLADFALPKAGFRPAPFWFWNHKLDGEELKRQIRHMYDSGYGGFVMHARHGLVDDYLGDAWYAAVETSLAEARRLGMLAWFYDEDNWPSGTCSQRVTDTYPDFRMTSIHLAGRAVFTPGGPPPEKPSSSEPIAVVAVANDETKGRFVAAADTVLPWSEIDVACDIFWFERAVFTYPGRFPDERHHYLDTLNPAAVRAFVKLTHAAHAKRIPEPLHRFAQGWFTDEPTGNFNCGKHALPWTPGLPTAFAERFGYDLLPRLPLLFAGGERAAKVRSDFFETCAQLYSQAFYGTIRKYVRRHGHKSIGHMNVEGELHWGVRQQFDYFRNARQMDWGGVDSLFCMTWKREGHFTDNASGAKLAASAAKLYGLERVMSENFGGSGWEFAPRHARWILGFLSVCGINYWIPHAYYYSIESYRKSEWPPSHGEQSSLSPSMRAVNDYAARLNVCMSGGRSVADVAVIYPNRSVWADLDTNREWSWDRKNDGGDACERYETDLTDLTETLMRLHFDFDFLPEEALDTARVADAALTVHGVAGQAGETYRAILLPNCRMLRAESVDRLRAFNQAGGRVIVVGVAPQVVAHTGAAIDPPFWNVQLSAVDKLLLAADLAAVSRASVRIEGKGAQAVVARRYRRGREEILLLANTDLDIPAEVTVGWPIAGRPLSLNLETGQAERLPSSRRVVGEAETTVKASIDPGAAVAFAIGGELPARRPAASPSRPEVVLELDTLWDIMPQQGNILVLDGFAIRHEMTREGIVPILRTTCMAKFSNHGYRGDVRLILDGIFSHKQGLCKPCPLPLDGCRLNGRQVKLSDSIPGERLDRFARELDVTDFMNQGENCLEFQSVVVNREPFVPPVPLYLTGGFGIAGDGCLVDLPTRIHSQRAWEEQGFPRYSGRLTYEQTFRFELRENARYVLELADVRETARVRVNQVDFGVRHWPPYRFDVTAALKGGDNHLSITVANSLAALVNGGTASGLLGHVRLTRQIGTPG